MSQEIIRNSFPGIAASNIANRAVVGLAAGATQRQVVSLATVNAYPHGVALVGSAGASVGDAVTIFDQGNYVKAVAAGSLGVGAEIGVASTNGGLAPVAGASGSLKFSVGQSIEPAAVGEVFSFYVNPRLLSGTP